MNLVLIAAGAALAVLVPVLARTCLQSRRAHARYDRYARQLLSKHFQLTPRPVNKGFKTLRPWKALGLFTVAGTLLRGERLAWVNLSDTTMAGFMKLHTFFFRGDPDYNIPMLSIDVIFMGSKRFFVIEIIDPAKINDENLQKQYRVMRGLKPSSEALEDEPVTRWYKDVVADFSIHAKADQLQDDLLFETYRKYLDAYVDLVHNAAALTPEQSRQARDAVEQYVNTLISRGGPAVDMLEKLMGPGKMREYARTVMFGLEA